MSQMSRFQTSDFNVECRTCNFQSTYVSVSSDEYSRLALLVIGMLHPSVLLLIIYSRLCTHAIPVNTAARMCKFSNRTESGSIRCSVQIGSHPSLAQNPDVISVSQGLVSIKGKGKMQVYDVLFTGDAQTTESNTNIAQTLSRPRCTPAPESDPFGQSACAQHSHALTPQSKPSGQSACAQHSHALTPQSEPSGHSACAQHGHALTPQSKPFGHSACAQHSQTLTPQSEPFGQSACAQHSHALTPQSEPFGQSACAQHSHTLTSQSEPFGQSACAQHSQSHSHIHNSSSNVRCSHTKSLNKIHTKPNSAALELDRKSVV